MARQLKDQESTGRQHAKKLLDVAAGVGRRDVLEHERREDECEAGVGKKRQVVSDVQVIGTASGVAVVAARQSQHRCRNVDAVAAVERSGHRLRHTADAATEVERAAPRHDDAQPRGALQDSREFFGSRSKELVDVPAAIALSRIREHRPQGILPGESIPMTLQGPEAH